MSEQGCLAPCSSAAARKRRARGPGHYADTLLGLAAALALTSVAFGDELPVDPSWAQDTVWDDGLAEVSVYDAETVVYGIPRAHQMTMILVKEDLSNETRVKADPPYEGRKLTSVLKLNLVSTVPTENYPYHFLASIFVRRDDVRRLVKATVGSQEWCGNTFKEILPGAGGARLHHHSYFDGEGDGESDLPLGPDGLLSEQLLVALRASSLVEGASVRLRVADPIVDNRARPVKVRAADLLAGPVERVDAQGGTTRTCRRFDLRFAGGGAASYWIETGDRRAVVRMSSTDGSKLTLKEQRRRNYWSR
jgi:hypothetical protein